MLLVNARLKYILRNGWYMRLPNNTAAYTASTKHNVASCNSWHTIITETEQDIKLDINLYNIKMIGEIYIKSRRFYRCKIFLNIFFLILKIVI